MKEKKKGSQDDFLKRFRSKENESFVFTKEVIDSLNDEAKQSILCETEETIKSIKRVEELLRKKRT